MEKIKYAVLTLLLASGLVFGRTTPVRAAEVDTGASIDVEIGPEAGSFFQAVGVGAVAGAVVGAYACGVPGAAVGTLAGAVAAGITHLLGNAENLVNPERALD